MRAAIGPTILIATLAGPFLAQAKVVRSVVQDRFRAHDVNARLTAAKAARFAAAVEACSVTIASVCCEQHSGCADFIPFRLAVQAPAEATVAWKVNALRPVVLRL